MITDFISKLYKDEESILIYFVLIVVFLEVHDGNLFWGATQGNNSVISVLVSERGTAFSKLGINELLTGSSRVFLRCCNKKLTNYTSSVNWLPLDFLFPLCKTFVLKPHILY